MITQVTRMIFARFLKKVSIFTPKNVVGFIYSLYTFGLFFNPFFKSGARRIFSLELLFLEIST